MGWFSDGDGDGNEKSMGEKALDKLKENEASNQAAAAENDRQVQEAKDYGNPNPGMTTAEKNAQTEAQQSRGQEKPGSVTSTPDADAAARQAADAQAQYLARNPQAVYAPQFAAALAKSLPTVNAQQVGVQDPGAATQTAQPGQIMVDPITGERVTAQQIARTQLGPMQTYTGTTIDPTQQAAFRNQQMALVNALNMQASGQGPSLAQAQLQQANEAAVASQMAQAASQRGINPALASRAAAQNIGNIQAQNAQESAKLRLAEQLQARQLLGQVTEGARGQDIGLATSQAQLSSTEGMTAAEQVNRGLIKQADLDADLAKTQAALALDADKFTADTFMKAKQANQSANLQARIQDSLNRINVDQFNAKAKDEMTRFATDAKLRADIANQAADLQAQGMNLDAASKKMGLEMESLKALLAASSAAADRDFQYSKQQDEHHIALAKNRSGAIGSALSAIGTAVTTASIFSDENAKENVQSSEKIGAFVNALNEYDYSYKKDVPGVGGQSRTGVMAQDIAKSDLGKEMVSKDEATGYLKVDTDKALQAALAGLAYLNKKIEGRK
jgi:hypothetical protein